MQASFFIALGFVVLVLGWELANRAVQRINRRWLGVLVGTATVIAGVYAAYFLVGAGFYTLLQQQ